MRNRLISCMDGLYQSWSQWFQRVVSSFISFFLTFFRFYFGSCWWRPLSPALLVNCQFHPLLRLVFYTDEVHQPGGYGYLFTIINLNFHLSLEFWHIMCQKQLWGCVNFLIQSTSKSHKFHGQRFSTRKEHVCRIEKEITHICMK